MVQVCVSLHVFIKNASRFVRRGEAGGTLTIKYKSLVMAAIDRNTRLQRELAMIRKRPNAGIWVMPSPDDIGLWHVVLAGAQGSDYDGGYYHGTIAFPDEYPFKAPSVKMLTPSGRFRINESICMSMTAWHPESWNPAWNIGTLTLGFSSFMHDDTDRGVASIQETPAVRRALAVESMAHNMKNATFVSLFPDVIAEWEARKEEACKFAFVACLHRILPYVMARVKEPTVLASLETLKAAIPPGSPFIITAFSLGTLQEWSRAIDACDDVIEGDWGYPYSNVQHTLESMVAFRAKMDGIELEDKDDTDAACTTGAVDTVAVDTVAAGTADAVDTVAAGAGTRVKVKAKTKAKAKTKTKAKAKAAAREVGPKAEGGRYPKRERTRR